MLGAIWSLFLLASCLNLRYLLRKYPTPPKYAWLWITLIALFARLIPNVILPMGAEYDIESFRIAGSLILQGEDVYASPLAIDRHPYLPLQLYWMAAAVWIADNLNLSYVAVYRLLPIFADLGVALLLFKILRVKEIVYLSFMKNKKGLDQPVECGCYPTNHRRSSHDHCIHREPFAASARKRLSKICSGVVCRAGNTNPTSGWALFGRSLGNRSRTMAGAQATCAPTEDKRPTGRGAV